MVNNVKIYKSKKINTFVIAMVILFLSIPQIAFADTDDFCSGTWSNSSSLTIQWFDSIYDHYTSTAVGFWWNGYTNNVKIPSQRVGGTSDEGYDIRIKGSSSMSDWGSTQNYIKVLGVPVPSWSGTWSHSIININTSTLMDDELLPVQKKVVVHEIGHALGLDHPAPDSTHTSINAIMKQGDKGYYTIQTHDGDNLKAKYN